jgi:hypothetical protein
MRHGARLQVARARHGKLQRAFTSIVLKLRLSPSDRISFLSLTFTLPCWQTPRRQKTHVSVFPTSSEAVRSIERVTRRRDRLPVIEPLLTTRGAVTTRRCAEPERQNLTPDLGLAQSFDAQSMQAALAVALRVSDSPDRPATGLYLSLTTDNGCSGRR